MSSSGSTIVDPRFSERVARIEANRAKAPDTPKRKPRGDGVTYVLSLVAAFGVGMLVVVAARYAWLIFDTFKNGPPKTELEMVLEADAAKEKS